jgi:plasmid stability protein
MPSVQVKDVPEDVHATLRRRAAVAGQSLQEYLLARLVNEARSPTLD